MLRTTVTCLLDHAQLSVSGAERDSGVEDLRAGWTRRMMLDLRKRQVTTQLQTYLVRRDGAMGRLGGHQ